MFYHYKCKQSAAAAAESVEHFGLFSIIKHNILTCVRCEESDTEMVDTKAGSCCKDILKECSLSHTGGHQGTDVRIAHAPSYECILQAPHMTASIMAESEGCLMEYAEPVDFDPMQAYAYNITFEGLTQFCPPVTLCI